MMKKEVYSSLIKADFYANKFKRKIPIPCWDYIQIYLQTLRKVERFSMDNDNITFFQRIRLLFYKYKLKQISIKLGISIEPGCFGGGLTLYHYGSIVVNGSCSAGEFCTL